MHKYRKKAVYFLVGYLIIFAAVLVIALWSERSGSSLINIGLPPAILNWTIIILSLLGIIKVLFEIADIESHHEYERRMKSKAT